MLDVEDKGVEKSKRKILGVCAWMADKFEVDLPLLRITFLGAFLLGLGSPGLLYLILALIRPSGY